MQFLLLRQRERLLLVVHPVPNENGIIVIAENNNWEIMIFQLQFEFEK